jgi:PhnB protein
MVELAIGHRKGETELTKIHLAPYINFQGHAREAMEHYQKVLGGKLEMFTADERGQPKPAGQGDSIMYARLESEAVVIVASDGNPKYPAKVGEHIGLSLVSSDRARLTKAFDELAEGGQVKMPLTDQPWGTAGWLTDRFGINWNIDIEKS